MSAGKKFREALAANSPLQIVGTINAYSAMMAKKIGHQAIYLSGGGVANASYGLPDLGMTSLNDVIVDVQRITSACDLPLLVDIDTGWGGAFNIAKTIRDMHAEDLSAVSDKLFMLLYGWLGGPNLYLQKYGTICLSTPHSKYAIGPAERDQWLACMDGALDNVGASEELKAMLKEPMFNLADVMCNRD